MYDDDRDGTSGKTVQEKDFREKAKEAFERELRQKMHFILKKCYAGNFLHHLTSLNSIIDAGSRFGVTEARPLSNDSLQGLADKLSPLRVLNLDDEIYSDVEFALVQECNIDTRFFETESDEDSPDMVRDVGDLYIRYNAALNKYKDATLADLAHERGSSKEKIAECLNAVLSVHNEVPKVCRTTQRLHALLIMLDVPKEFYRYGNLDEYQVLLVRTAKDLNDQLFKIDEYL